MKVRTRLILAFGYTLVVVIIALEVPLAINLQRRALAELRTGALVQAQTLASSIGGEGVAADTNTQKVLDRIYQPQPGVRVIVVNADGRLAADSAHADILGQPYATAARPELQQAMDTGQPATVIRYSEDLHQNILATAVPIVDEGVRGAVRVTQSMADVGANVRRTTLALVAIGLAGLLGGMFVAWLLASSLVRPLSRLAGVARELGDGDLEARVGGMQGAREIEDVARAFDEMADRVQSAMDAQSRFVANASHQLRTPLTGMKLRIETAEETADEETRHQLEAADREVDRLADIVDDLLATARVRESGTGDVSTDLPEAADRALARWTDRAQRAGAELARSGGAATARATTGDVDQILDNLLDNAISYAPGPIAITTERRGEDAILTVVDSGPGIDPDETRRLTERFYRGRGAPVGGSGLGLAIVRDLAERWDGRVEVSTGSGGRGLVVTVAFPDAGDAASEP